MTAFDPAAVEALAETWASIDGKLNAFCKGKFAESIEAYGGNYAGYMSEAHEMLERLFRRGFILVPNGRPSMTVNGEDE